MPGTVFASARVTIRTLGLEDAGPLRAMHADRRVTALLIDDDGVPLDQLANATAFIRAVHGLYRRYAGYGIWAVESSVGASVGGAGLFCGFIALMPVDELPGDVEIGIRLAPSAWGGGLSFEATRLVLVHGFDVLGLPAIFAFCDPRNRSARLNNEAQGAVWLRDAHHQGALASHYRLSRAVFDATRHQTRGQRMRAILRGPQHSGLQDLLPPVPRG